MEKKELKTNPDDWGTDSIKTRETIPLSILLTMLPGAPPLQKDRSWEADLNQRRDWRPVKKVEKVEKKMEALDLSEDASKSK
jgi:hypothetical protein